jgi:TATA-box binding protein (TBP) (component of TFIID and TFIIIB)
MDLSSFQAELDDGFNRITSHKLYRSLVKNTFKITTMTTLFKLGSPFSLPKFVDSLNLCEFETQLSNLLPGTWSIKVSPRFFNCIIFSYKSPLNSKVAIKLFSNGSIHVTGCKSFNDIPGYIQPILSLIDNSTVSFHVQMINGSFKINVPVDYVIDLQLVFERITSDFQQYNCFYNKDHHPAVRIKLSKPITIMIFESGSILINAFLNGAQLHEAYDFIMSFFNTNLDNIITNMPKPSNYLKKRKTRDFDYSQFV